MTTVRLAIVGPRAGSTSALQDSHNLPALLVSYFYFANFKRWRSKMYFRDYVLDSGAFSAHYSGVVINLEKYIDDCKQLLATDTALTEVFALDVLGNWRASVKNAETMRSAGVPIIPCYHLDEPWDLLTMYAREYSKIALGGCARLHRGSKLAWARRCFTRVWPKRVHGFGFGERTAVLSLPWHSVDASSWETGPCAFGRWKRYGRASLRGAAQPLRLEVEYYLETERLARHRWAKKLQEIED